MSTKNSFSTEKDLFVDGAPVRVHSLAALEQAGFPRVSRLPYSLKILLENLLRREDGRFVRAEDIRSLASWDAARPERKEIAFTPARVLLQDFTGVPAVVDLAAMRDGIVRLGGDPVRVNPLQPVELVIDHSMQVDFSGRPDAFQLNAELESRRNQERYVFLRWGQDAFSNFRVVPPDTGIVHQVNLEYLARVVFSETADGRLTAYPDTLVGTDSHTTMVNGLGVLGWGVGGIEAEACMLGQPISMLIPDVLGFRLTGRLPEGATATDLVLTITERLRKHGVVGKFVEFYGPGLEHLPIADRATLSNMCPEYGATVAIFPIDEMTLDYLRLTGREESRVRLVEAYARAQGHVPHGRDAGSRLRRAPGAGPGFGRTEHRRPPAAAGPRHAATGEGLVRAGAGPHPGRAQAAGGAGGGDGWRGDLGGGARGGGDRVDHELHQHLEPERDDRRRSAGEEGGRARPQRETVGQDQPGAGIEGGDRVPSRGRPDAVSRSAGLPPGGLRLRDLHRQQRSAAPEVSVAVKDNDLVVASVLSGNRNFEGRIQPQVRANYLASPPLVVAYALAGSMTMDLTAEPLGHGPRREGRVPARTSGRRARRSRRRCSQAVSAESFRSAYADVFAGDERWQALQVPGGDRFQWADDSTYIRNPPFFEGLTLEPAPLSRHHRRPRARAARATASRPTTSRRPGRSQPTARLGST